MCGWACCWCPRRWCWPGSWRGRRGPARRGGHPLIDLGLFRIPSYADGLGVALLYFAAFTGTPLVLSLFLQEGLGFSALQSGLTASSFAVGAAVSAPIGGRLLGRYGGRVLVGALGLFVAGVSAAATLATLFAGTIPDGRLALLLTGPLLVAGLGGGSVITPNQALSLAEVDSAGGSTAGGTLQTAQRVGSALGAAVISAVFYAGPPLYWPAGARPVPAGSVRLTPPACWSPSVLRQWRCCWRYATSGADRGAQGCTRANLVASRPIVTAATSSTNSGAV